MSYDRQTSHWTDYLGNNVSPSDIAERVSATVNDEIALELGIERWVSEQMKALAAANFDWPQPTDADYDGIVAGMSSQLFDEVVADAAL